MAENMVMMFIIDILIIALLLVLIIVGIKAIFLIDNINSNLTDIKKKMHSFDGIFNFIDRISDTLAYIDTKIGLEIASITKFFWKLRKEKKDE